MVAPIPQDAQDDIAALKAAWAAYDASPEKRGVLDRLYDYAAIASLHPQATRWGEKFPALLYGQRDVGRADTPVTGPAAVPREDWHPGEAHCGRDDR